MKKPQIDFNVAKVFGELDEITRLLAVLLIRHRLAPTRIKGMIDNILDALSEDLRKSPSLGFGVPNLQPARPRKK